MIKDLAATREECRRPWLAVDDVEEEGVWKDHLTKSAPDDLPWAMDEPNGRRQENCGGLELDGLVDVDCKSYRCVNLCSLLILACYGSTVNPFA